MAKLKANTHIVTGDASTAKNGSTARGDQGQTKTPDYSGECLLHVLTSESAFKAKYNNWYIVRPVDPDAASQIAHLMNVACNNPNIGYVWGGTDMTSRGGSHTVDTTSPCGTDCAGLVCQCVSEAYGIKFYNATAGLVSALEKIKIGSTNAFMPHINFSSYAATPIYNGDILVKNPSGHTAIVVSGNPREGTEDELITTSNYSGTAAGIANYRATYTVQYSFEPRVEEPDNEDEGYQYYQTATSKSYGKSANGAYAWGRFSEICKSECDLTRGVPRTWYNHDEDKYPRGVAPSLGAVMCYTNIRDASHPGLVSVVELINPNYIYVSQVSTKTEKFEYIKRTQKNGSWDLDLDKDGINEFVFQGFIYNPSVETESDGRSSMQKFIDTLQEYVGKDGKSFTEKTTGIKIGKNGWSASFIAAAATVAGGILNVIIPDVRSCSALGSTGVNGGMGTWYNGPAEKGNPHPQVGDIALFRTSSNIKRLNKYSADKAGVVVRVDATQSCINANGKTGKYNFWVVAGDMNGKVTNTKYDTTCTSLCGLFRPNWSSIDGTTEAQKWLTSPLGMYTEGTELEDAAIRDLAYAKESKGVIQPSIKKSDIILSAINYTGLLSNMYSLLAEVSVSAASDANMVTNFWNSTAISEYRIDVNSVLTAYSGEYEDNMVDLSDVPNVVMTPIGASISTSKGTMTLTSTAQSIYNLLYAHIKLSAGVIGVMANMWQESGWNPGAVNKSDGGSGLIQWTDTHSKYGWSRRATQMKEYCQSQNNAVPWYSNVSGQIEFLFKEISTNSHYKDGMNQIKQVSDNIEGAQAACRIFLKYFELGKGQWGTSKETTELTRRYPFAIAAWKLFKGGQT